MRLFDVERVLRHARCQIADSRYWRQGLGPDNGLTEDPTCCVGDAIEVAAARLGLDENPALEAFARVVAPERDLSVEDSVIEAIVDWNDAPGRTHGEIVAAFDQAIRTVNRQRFQRDSGEAAALLMMAIGAAWLIAEAATAALLNEPLLLALGLG